jgi:hypothetical protein
LAAFGHAPVTPPATISTSGLTGSWLRGTYRGVSERQLQIYLDEFVFRFNRPRTPMAAFQTLLGIRASVPPTTYEEIKDGVLV